MILGDLGYSREAIVKLFADKAVSAPDMEE
jgi:hypothetical protein